MLVVGNCCSNVLKHTWYWYLYVKISFANSYFLTMPDFANVLSCLVKILANTPKE